MVKYKMVKQKNGKIHPAATERRSKIDIIFGNHCRNFKVSKQFSSLQISSVRFFLGAKLH